MQETIERIVRMEGYFDVLSAKKEGQPLSPEETDMLKALVEYMDSGLWLADFERDERGELPPGLKRGVLSEDGLYNLLCALAFDQDEE